jgi:hypothetical protein
MLTLVLLAMLSSAPSGSSETNVVLGTWEGESKCTVPDSPCHDEHVILEFKRDGETKLSLDAYKIVNGEKQFMGTLTCQLPKDYEISCTFAEGKRLNDWVYKFDDKKMTGTLYMDKERTVYRRINVAKR